MIFTGLAFARGTSVFSCSVYAYIDADDARHQECLALLERHPGPLAVPVLVIAEVAHLVETRLGSNAEVRFGDLASRHS